MVATITWKQCTSTDAGTETTTTNKYSHLTSSDTADDGTGYESNTITSPLTGTNYSYERWMRFVFTSTFNLIDNIKVYKSSGTLSDGNLVLNAGETDTGVTPINTVSSIATSAIPTVVGSAVDITPVNAIDASGEKTDYFVIQLVVPSTVTTPGNISSQGLTVQYDES